MMQDQSTATPLPEQPDFGECWVLPGTTRVPDQHTKIWVNGRHVGAHRHALAVALGRPLAPNEMACHTCDTPRCVRNDTVGVYVVYGVEYPRFGHLWLGDARANTADRDAKGRTASGNRCAARLYPERWPRGDRHPARLHPEYLARGEAHYNAKLTAADVTRIRIRYAAGGVTCAVLAREFHVSVALIKAVISRRVWKHVP
jgi:hypothetical protein